MRGKVVDMDLLRKKNELTPAIGNVKVNARGDELGPGGKIIRKREEIVREHYGMADETGGFKTTKETAAPSKLEEKAEALEEMEPFDPDDEWIEDEDGNFVKKGE